jgi:prophage antirepressor-like protein
MTNKSPLSVSHIAFESQKIRRIFHQDEWYFSIIDVVGALTESSIPKRY